MNKLMYWEWLPQIMYNHHQTGPAGTVIFTPPFRDPFNYNFDPMIVTGLDMVGAAMHHRFLQEGKPGFTMRSGSSYSTWWNGGLRTTAYFQNIIGLLDGDHRQPDADADSADREPDPAARRSARRRSSRRQWHFRQSIDYSVTANYAVLDLASRYKDQFLYNIYRMGANQIERGSRDHWTISNEDMARLQAAMAPAAGRAGGGRRPRRRARRRRRGAARAAAAPAARLMPARAAAAAAAAAASDGDLQRGVQGSGAPRSARLRHSRGPGRFADGHQVHQHAALHRHRDPAGDRAVDRRRQDLSRGLVRGEDGAGRTRARASTCSSPRITPTTWTSAASRAGRTTTPAGRSPTRWA